MTSVQDSRSAQCTEYRFVYTRPPHLACPHAHSMVRYLCEYMSDDSVYSRRLALDAYLFSLAVLRLVGNTQQYIQLKPLNGPAYFSFFAESASASRARMA